jgi:hypothetical protein
MGAMVLIGWVTKMMLYKNATTMKQRIRVTEMTTNPQTLTSISSGVRFSFRWWWCNLLLQNRGDQVFGASLGKQTLWLLAI